MKHGSQLLASLPLSHIGAKGTRLCKVLSRFRPSRNHRPADWSERQGMPAGALPRAQTFLVSLGNRSFLWISWIGKSSSAHKSLIAEACCCRLRRHRHRGRSARAAVPDPLMRGALQCVSTVPNLPETCLLCFACRLPVFSNLVVGFPMLGLGFQVVPF